MNSYHKQTSPTHPSQILPVVDIPKQNYRKNPMNTKNTENEEEKNTKKYSLIFAAQKKANHKAG